MLCEDLVLDMQAGSYPSDCPRDVGLARRKAWTAYLVKPNRDRLNAFIEAAKATGDNYEVSYDADLPLESAHHIFLGRRRELRT